MRSVLLLVVAMTLGCKGDPVKCEKACRNYAELVYWDEAEKEIAALPAPERDALRKKKMAEFSNHLSRGVDMCSSKCMSANHKEDIECLINAKTAKEAKSCTTRDY
jgi:hypothetical protein